MKTKNMPMTVELEIDGKLWRRVERDDIIHWDNLSDGFFITFRYHDNKWHTYDPVFFASALENPEPEVERIWKEYTELTRQIHI